MLRRLALCLLATASTSATSMAWAETPETTAIPTYRTYSGPSQPMGQGRVWSWIRLNRVSRPVAVGISFTGKALEGLPAHHVERPLYLPFRVRPFNHFQIDWEPGGHEPPGVYDLPHFDFHFFMITRRTQVGITCSGADLANCEQKPPEKYWPVGYAWTPGGVPRMGSHWVDPTSPEFNGQTFTRTMIYGFYKGRMAFIEPMVTRAHFLTRPQSSLPIKQPLHVQKTGYYPTSYRLSYNSVRDRYTVALEGLRWRVAD